MSELQQDSGLDDIPEAVPEAQKALLPANGLADPDRGRRHRGDPGGQDLPEQGADHQHHLQDRRRSGGGQDQDQVQGCRGRPGPRCYVKLPRTSGA